MAQEFCVFKNSSDLVNYVCILRRREQAEPEQWVKNPDL